MRHRAGEHLSDPLIEPAVQHGAGCLGVPTAAELGRKAHNERRGTHTNPYDAMTPERTAWHHGWCLRNAECAAMGAWHRINPCGD